MARKHALINNNVVTSIVEIEPEDYLQYAKSNDMVVDVEEHIPTVAVGFVLNGNQLQIPQNVTDREVYEIELNQRKSDFGSKLAWDAINKFAARNKILNKTGAQIIALITQMLPVKILMDTGALGTARSSCVQLRAVYTEYDDIFAYIIAQINAFESQHGL